LRLQGGRDPTAEVAGRGPAFAAGEGWTAAAEPLFNFGMRSLLWLAFDPFQRAGVTH
jgi:hypothetical protein